MQQHQWKACLLECWACESQARGNDQYFSACGSWPIWGSHIKCLSYQIFRFWFITTSEFQLWSSNEIILWLGVRRTWGVVVKGESIRKVEHTQGLGLSCRRWWCPSHLACAPDARPLEERQVHSPLSHFSTPEIWIFKLYIFFIIAGRFI